jgi:general secretion pathway protein D
MLQNLSVVAAVLLLASCTTAGGGVDDSAEVQPAAADVDTRLSGSAAELAIETKKERERAEPILYLGNDRQVKVPVPEEPVRFVGKDVSLNFEQAPLEEVMHAIMGDMLKLDYVVDRPVQGKVTLRTRTPIPRDQLLGVLESLLKSNNALMIKGSDGRYLITGAQKGVRLSPGVASSFNTAAGYSVVIVPLQYISASNMAEILRPLAEESAFVRIDNSRNLLMLAGTRNQLDGWQGIIATFDVDLLQGMSMGLFPLENSGVEETASALSAMLSSGVGGSGDMSALVRVIPVKRMNSILIVTPRAHYIDSIQVWIERLDEMPHSNFEKRLFVYPVQNTTAGRLADLLNNIYSGSGGRGGSGSSGGGVAPGMSPETLGSSSGGLSGKKGKRSGGGSAMAALSMLAGSAGDASAIEGIRVVADDENNALMIYATGKQYGIIEAALAQLDVVATQVIIEASILEVTLSDELKYGLEWTFKNGLGSSYDGTGLLESGGDGLAAVIPGFSYSVTNSVGDISAVLNALSKDSLLNVISTPSVMVVDNHKAYIHVGDQVPVFSAQTITDGGKTTQSVEYKDTGVKLTVKPSVNAGGLVTMDVEQSVTDVGEIDSATGQRAFLERTILTRVAVRSNESVVLGGLIRERAAEGSSGVPFLHSLPLIGPLFGTTVEEDRRTELLVIITPRVMYNETELREVSKEMRLRIRHMDLIETETN